MLELQLHPEVEAEIEDWATILAEHSDRAPIQFLAEVRSAFQRICEHPTHAHFIYRNYRRLNLIRFSQAIIYREHSNAVYVIAMMHEKRHPDYWKYRIADKAG
ncbi:hypothetical protein [Prosthecobacter sp.]|uniref:hypothetical protein n=1 Tax=Prosthecobacter sp. TaxID=1965333 RepID=UPI00378470DD